MADRTWVELTVATKDVKRVELLMGDHWHYDHVEVYPYGVTVFSFDDVYNGELTFLENLEEPIAYDSEWEGRGDCRSGGCFSRISKGGICTVKKIYKEDGGVNLLKLIKARDNNRIDEFIEQEKVRIYVMPWKEQLAILSELEK